jgi:Tfp pilus assembly PilM family ATPase
MKFPFRFRKNIITVLEIDGDWLKIVQAKPLRKERKISKVVIKNISSLSNDAIIGIIIDLSKELGINPSFLLVSVPHHLVAARNLELPSTNFNEIRDMVDLQIGKQTPFSKDEIVYDYQILGTNQEGYSEVMSLIIQRKIIERYFEILGGAGFKTEKIGLSSEGLLGWSRFACKQKGTDKPYILIDLNHLTSDFEVILKDKLIYSRNISLGVLQSKEKPDEWQERFIAEVKNSIYAYQNEMPDRGISQVVISGAELVIGGLDGAVLGEKLGLLTEVISASKDIPLTKEALDAYKASPKDISISSLLGLALIYPEQKINFIPQELQIEKGVKEKGRDLYFLGIYLVFILVTITSIFLGRMYNKERYLYRLKQEMLEIQDKVDRLNNMVGEMQVARERLAMKGISLKFIYEVHKAVSPEIHLLSVNFDGKDHLTLRGTSKTMSEVFNFINSLEESKYFQNVKTKYATRHKVKDKEVADFEIVCPLSEDLQQRLVEIGGK